MNVLSRLLRALLSGFTTPEDTNLGMKPCRPEELQKKLRNGKVTFFFKKKNGDLRMAYGTLKMRFVPSEHHPQGLKEPSPKVVTFFDLTKKAWRCVSVNEEIFIK